MPFPTATITQGSGLTINTLPNAGQATMVNSLGVTIASDQSVFPITSLSSGAITNPTSVLTRPASAVSASVTGTVTSPAVFTWTGNPLVNGQGVVLTGTLATGFTTGTIYYAVSVSGNNFSLALTFGGTAINATAGSFSGVTASFVYASNSLIASSATAGSVVVPSFAIATSAGGAILPRLRLRTNATSGWGGAGVSLSINLWSAAPTYTNGDGGPYAVATGSAGWLGNFLMSMTQFADGAVGAAPLTGANKIALKLASGTSVFWDLQTLLPAQSPVASQTFTLTAELMN